MWEISARGSIDTNTGTSVSVRRISAMAGPGPIGFLHDRLDGLQPLDKTQVVLDGYAPIHLDLKETVNSNLELCAVIRPL